MRIFWIDSWKGLLMLLVVAGHVVGMGGHLAGGNGEMVLSKIYKAIYLFHMPAFFCVAGCLWRDESFGLWLKKKSYRLLVPYFVVGFFSAVVFCSARFLIGQSGCLPDTWYYNQAGNSPAWQYFAALLHGGRWPHGDGFRPNSVLWFLPCLLLTSVVFYWIRWACEKWGRWLWGLVSLVVMLLAIVSQYQHYAYWPLGAERVPYFLLFMVLGYLGMRKLMSLEMATVWRKCFSVGLFSGYWVVAYCLRERYDTTFMEYWWFPIYFLVSAWGCWASFLTAKAFQGNGLIACGVLSMGIMLFHKFFVVGGCLVLAKISKIWRAGIGGAVGAAAIVTLMSLFLAYWVAKLVLRFCPWVVGCSRRKISATVQT